MRNRERNLDQLRLAAIELEPLLDRVVFLGGCTTGLFITDSAAADIRPTKDVDVIIELSGQPAYHVMEETLRTLGFTQPLDEDGPICRWHKDLLAVDVMPTDPSILGFGNRWYTGAIATTSEVDLGKGLIIRMVTAPMFVATKLEAFEGRGKGDFYGSHDLEDIVAVIDGRLELLEELRRSDDELRSYVAERFQRYAQLADFANALPGLLQDSGLGREQIVHKRISEICTLDRADA